MRSISAALPMCSVAALLIATRAAAQDFNALSIKPMEQGVPYSLAITETERFPTKSYLHIPGFHERSAPGMRSPMCFYTSLAIEREFSYWFVVYPAGGSNRVVVGFSNSAEESPEKLLGADYVKALAIGSNMMPVQQMADLCGIKVNQ